MWTPKAFGKSVSASTSPSHTACRYFPRTYRVGARIHSDSWGSNFVSYDFDCESLDKYAYETPDFLSIFSAGNYGLLQSQYGVTVNAPALAKNTIAVGNALNANEYTPFSASAVPIHAVKFMVQAGNATSSVQVRVAQAAFSGAWKAWPSNAPVVLADPIEV